MLFTILSTAVAGFVLLALLLYYYMEHKNSYWKKRNVIHQQPTLFFGNIKDQVLRRVTVTDPTKKLYEAFPNEKVVGIYRMWTPNLLIRDPEVLKHILIKDFDLFVDRGIEFSTKGLGANLFLSDGDTWRVLRSRLSPIFTAGKLKNMMPLLLQQGDKFMAHLERLVKQNPEVNVYSLVQKFTIGAISSCAFGLDIDIEEFSRKGNVFERLDKLIFTNKYVKELEMAFPGLFKKINISLFPAFTTDFFFGLVNNLIKDRKGMPSNRKDFMDLLLELQNTGDVHGSKKHENDKDRVLQITPELMAAQAFVFYAAGYETSASTLSFFFRQMALEQEIQDKIVEEIKQVLSTTDGKITFEALNEMKYLGQVFDETLRMYPIIDIQRNLNIASYKIPGTDITVEKNTIMLVSVRGIHHDEKYYPDPEKFDPERFSPENVRERHPCAYLPFGAGPRNCIGMRFAKIQTRLAAVSLLQKYRVVPSPNTKTHIEYDPMRITLAIKGENMVNLVPRT